MRIVIVEDEAPIRNGMSKILQKIHESYRLVGAAENGIQGLKVIEETKPDLIIMDIHMPDMDGLTMLAKVREKGMNCKAVVLTAYSDFTYAKMAIELGIENYMLKPIKIPELKRTLRQVELELMAEQSKEQFFSLESIFHRSATGQFQTDKETDAMLWKQYRISREEELILFLVELGAGYELYHDTVKALLEDVDVHNDTFRSCTLEYPDRCVVLMILYGLKDGGELQAYFQKSVMPALVGQVPGRLICGWKECRGLKNVNLALKEIREKLGWNLVFGKGILISEEKIAERETVPIRYPIDIEVQAKQAIIHNKEKEFAACVQKVQDYCKGGAFDVKEIKEVCNRYGMAVFQTARESGKLSEDISTQDLMKDISKAVTWQEIEGIFEQFTASMYFQREEESTSLMVQRAKAMIQEYYNQGITLEEIARKLCVSEEYLSGQFRKETGKTFSETIRGYRMEKVKELLLKSSLKINQIADMAGYTDPKYMSKVFKEEVGVTPAEYRKLNN